jgi:hypothetical protein
MRPIASFLSVFCLIASSVALGETSSMTGRFLGTGRACHGTLDVRTGTISWMTTFSACTPGPYEVVEQNKSGEELRLTYRLKDQASNCRYAILSLSHQGSVTDTGWEVMGYGTERSYQADKASGYQAKAPDIMSCYLIRDHRTH